MTVSATSKYRDSSSRTTSGSRASDSGVNPTTSQNRTEHTRRSATGPLASQASSAAAGEGRAAAGAGAAGKARPHDRQNRLPGISGSPQVGQPPTLAPQSPQNRSPSPSDAPHCPHLNQISYVRLVSAANRGPAPAASSWTDATWTVLRGLDRPGVAWRRRARGHDPGG